MAAKASRKSGKSNVIQLQSIGITPGFSEPEQLTQHKSKRLIEGFVATLCLSVLYVGYQVSIANKVFDSIAFITIVSEKRAYDICRRLG